MKKYAFLISLGLFACSDKKSTEAPQAKAEPTIDYCSEVAGAWKGSHFYDSAEVLSNYDLSFNKDGTTQMQFTITDSLRSVRNESYSGTWECKENLLITQTKDNSGVEHNYKYKILSVSDSKHMKYENIYPNEFGPTFEATKIAPSHEQPRT